MALGIECCASRLWQVPYQSGSRQAKFISLIAKLKKKNWMKSKDYSVLKIGVMTHKKKGTNFDTLFHIFQTVKDGII
jgi:hypothetical protein